MLECGSFLFSTVSLLRDDALFACRPPPPSDFDTTTVIDGVI
jgi:hypothetical protein